MKKLLPSIVLGICLLFGFSSFSQTVNGVALQDLDVEYIRIYNSTIGLNPPINIDFGRGRVAVSNSRHNILRDEHNQPINFNTMLDALNFLAKHGFELVQAYVAAYDDHRDMHFYILRRKQTP
jgi:hypothetical protein